MDRAGQMMVDLAGREFEVIGRRLRSCEDWQELLFLIGRISRLEDDLFRILWDAMPQKRAVR